MKITASALFILSAFAKAEDYPSLKVNQYEGPKECGAEDTIEEGNFLTMHYTGKIDESSETGEKGLKFDSSLDRDMTFDFQIGVGHVIPGMSGPALFLQTFRKHEK
jgi:FKBP-type peptidyl-prolyl cis-trans isomerase